MGLTNALARLSARRLHVLVVEHPGAFVTRARTERAVTARGWVLATSPADADALLECGAAGDEPQIMAVEHVWSQVPGPRSRSRLSTVSEVESTLNALAAGYRQWSAQEARQEPGPERPDDQPEPHHNHDEGQSEGQSERDVDEIDDMDDDMDMSGPGGIALASGSDDDRDGLEMDVLHVPLGPVLASWPVGLVVTCTLSGDVIAGVEVRVTAADTPTGTSPETHIGTRTEAVLTARAYRLDAAARVLDLTGAEALAGRVRSARDQILDAESPDLADLCRRVGRSWALRRSLRRVGPVSLQQAAAHGWPGAWVGDAYDRLLRLTAVSTETSFAATGLDTVGKALPDLLVGSEFASARLTVASLVGHPS